MRTHRETRSLCLSECGPRVESVLRSFDAASLLALTASPHSLPFPAVAFCPSRPYPITSLLLSMQPENKSIVASPY